MPTHEFRIGDIVQLKSGGPRMTVSEPETASEKVTAQRFDNLNYLKTASFHAGALIAAPDLPTNDKLKSTSPTATPAPTAAQSQS